MNTPILLITFNRPEHTRKVLEAIMAAQPKDLYVFQDGAREGNEKDLVNCPKVREVVQNLVEGTETNLHTYYSERNLGCGPGPMTAISWFFSNINRGVIFEDDCLPHPDFFQYCEELLARYETNHQVSFIGGCNYGCSSNYSYDFCSGHHQTWGWATWKRTWQSFDYRLDSFSRKDFKRIIKFYYPSLKEQEYWLDIFDAVKKDQINGTCWDYQFYFSCWRKQAFAICPSVNLVSNVGYGEDATHTSNGANALLSRNVDPIMPLNHPDKVKLNKNIDKHLMKSYIIPYYYGVEGLKRLPYRLNKRIKRLVGHEGPWLKKKK